MFFFFKQMTAYEMRISDWSSDVCSSDLAKIAPVAGLADPILGVERDALIIVLGDDVDRPRDRIRSVDRRPADRDRLDAIDDDRRDDVEIDLRSDRKSVV